MADGDTLAVAEERVLQRAKRRAVEEAGVYLESTFHDIERIAGGVNSRSTALEIRTIAAAITKTEVLEFHRSFESGRPTFSIRIRAAVDLESLKAAVSRWKSEQQLAQHFRSLQKENAELKAQLKEFSHPSAGVRMLAIESDSHRGRERAQALLEEALVTHDMERKLELATQAAILDPESPDPLIVRGQTYLRLVTAAYSSRSKPSEYSPYVDQARMDFDRALLIDGKNSWAWLGLGDVHTWLNRPETSAADYEQALLLDPYFDVARQRLIALRTSQARRLMNKRQPGPALDLLDRLLRQSSSDTWLPYLKEAYLLRSQIYRQLNKPKEAIDDLSSVLQADPTHAEALFARGSLYREQLLGQGAKEDFEHACLLGSAAACEQLPLPRPAGCRLL
jgi:tetratricopeptide (TPR) repeat protein